MTILAVEAGIVARLKDRISSAKVASGAAIAGGAVDVAKLEPIVIVQIGESSVLSSSHDGTGVVEEQVWIVGAVMAITPDGLLLKNYAAIDALITSIVSALAGFSIAGAMGTLSYTGRDAPSVEAGLIEVPLRFTARVFLQA